MRIKRILCLLLIGTILCMTGCASSAGMGEGNEGKISIVCTIFPQYDWTRSILGDNPESIDLKLLVSNGADLHSYQPTAADIAMISNADIVVYVGGESDRWVEDAMDNAVNPNQVGINMMEVIGDRVTQEVLVEGMEEEESEGEGEEIEYDEHVWMSIENAEIIATEVERALEDINPEQVTIYQSNLNKLLDDLKLLDEEYRDMVTDATKDTVIFGDRFPFHYLLNEYGIQYYAAFPGCSADTEADFETVIFLANKVDECQQNYVLIVANSNQTIANAIIENTQEGGQQIETLNSMETISEERIEAGDTYLSIMQSNLEVLRIVLN